ncbi:MerR family transcriptional regulator [Streptomyces spirodelae]|uniref:MerR family transcriptional regulator n=1 Tax=Streptomyces spirodelae TaxID=2812904 RepID=A0ABS3WZ89_9ACTN|nr:MerR family transcriptional regulator [Streptomyces spirodelae]MBO8188438.1 MerR family transcriptional regulator [Streptomyces spirodelae]
MRMKEMVRRTGVHERLLRYYEQQGLLSPHRLPSGYREYNETDVETVRRVRCLLTAGLSTSVIAQLLPCLRDEQGRLVPTCPDLVAELLAQRDRMTAQIEALHTSRGLLDDVLTATPDALKQAASAAGAAATAGAASTAGAAVVSAAAASSG